MQAAVDMHQMWHISERSQLNRDRKYYKHFIIHKNIIEN